MRVSPSTSDPGFSSWEDKVIRFGEDGKQSKSAPRQSSLVTQTGFKSAGLKQFL
jgi:hypothetical protein